MNHCRPFFLGMVERLDVLARGLLAQLVFTASPSHTAVPLSEVPLEW